MAFAVAFAVVPCSSASAAPESRTPASAVTRQAKARFRAGAELYRQARYREAIAEFEAAYRLKPHGVIFFNLAQCHERLGDIPAALRAYHEYLRAVPEAEDRATVQAAMSNLEARLAASGVQQLLVYSDPPGAEVHVDGQARGQTPFAAVLPHGPHSLTLTKPGYATVRREAVLAPDRSLELDVSLPRGEPGPVASPSQAAPLEQGAPSLRPSPRAGEPALSIGTGPPAQPPARRPRVWTWVAAGAAGAALAAGVAYGLAARSASDDLRRAEHDGATSQRLADSAGSRARTANVLYGVAAVAGAAGVTLFFVEGRF